MAGRAGNADASLPPAHMHVPTNKESQHHRCGYWLEECYNMVKPDETTCVY